MRILVDILHPAHVHFFRNYIAEAKARGDQVLVTSRDKDVTEVLLDAYGIDHQTISTKRSGGSGLTTEWAARTVRLFRIARRFDPDVMLGIMGVSVAPVGKMLRRPAIVFYDTEVARRTNSIVYPMAASVVTPDCYEAEPRSNQTMYPGYHELAYLHPDRFSPDVTILEQFGLDRDEPYAIVRFVDQDSSHDGSEVALSASQKTSLVRELADNMHVRISSEGVIPDDLKELNLNGPLHQVHHVLAFASTYIGESATMASEAAMLSTPSVFIGQTSRGYVNELSECYGLIERFVPMEAERAARAAIALATQQDLSTRSDSHLRMLGDKTDVTTWMLTFMDQFR